MDARLVGAQVGWAVTAGRVARTKDDGRTWSDVTPAGLTIVFQPRDPDNESVAHTNVIGVDFKDSSRAHLAIAKWSANNLAVTVWATEDEGATWSLSTLPPIKTDIPVLQVNSSSDAWVASMAFPDDQHGYLYLEERLGGLIGPEAVSPHFAFRTVDGGRAWVQSPSPSWGSYFAFSGTERGWSTQGDQLLTTSDGGQTWSPVVLPGLTNLPVSLRFTKPIVWSADRITVGPIDTSSTSTIRLESTEDAGLTWHLLTRARPADLGGDISLIDLDTWIAPYGYTADQPIAVGMALTRDGGRKWSRTPSRSGLPAPSRTHFTDSAHGWSLVWNPKGHEDLYGTVNGGVTWSLLKP